MLGPLDMAEQSLLCSLPAAQPNTANISFAFYTMLEHSDRTAFDTISATLSNVICGWKYLRCVSFATPLTPRALLHLSEMPVLREAKLTILEDENFGYLAHSYRPPFLALRELSISCRSVLSCGALLNAISWHQLESVDVNATGIPDDAAEIRTFFRVLSSQCSNTSLKRIILTMFTYMPTSSLDNYIIDEDILSPLLSFHNLTALELYTCHAFRINNKTLHMMAMSWRRLQTLELGLYGWAGQSRVTLAGLVPLVQYCAELVELGVVVDATIVEPPLYMSTPNAKVVHLRLGDSVIQDPASVAAYLSGLFPKLNSVWSWIGVTPRRPEVTPQEEEKYRARWDEAVRLTKIFADVRQVERTKMDTRDNRAE
jgi:hypothetical protein